MSHGLAPVRGQWAPHSAQSLLLLGIFTFIWIFVLAILVAQSALRSVTRSESAPTVKKSNVSVNPPRSVHAPTFAALPPRSPAPTEEASTSAAVVPGGLEKLPEPQVALPQATPDAHKRSGAQEVRRAAPRPTDPHSAEDEKRAIYSTAKRDAPEVAAIVRDVRDTRPSVPVIHERPAPQSEPLPSKFEPAPARVNTPSSTEPSRKPPTTPASADIF